MKKIQINKVDKSVKILLNKKIYDIIHIEKAVVAFSENFEVKSDDDIITFSNIPEKYVDTVGYEFYNYILESMKN